jgi:hypothetical protein
MGLPGMVLSAIAAAAGAIMYWAVTYQGTGFRLSTAGLILMIAGAFGFVVSAIVFAVSRGPERTPRHSLDRQVVDSAGNSVRFTKTRSSHADPMNARTRTSEFSNAESSATVLTSKNVNHFGKEYLLCI